jgi:zinc/manganese transport system permease protein
MIIVGRASASGPLTGFANMLGHPFITHALVAGSAVAVLCGLVGYFLVLRGQVFAGDAQGHVAYTGAMAALVAGLDPRIGLFAATIMAASRWVPSIVVAPTTSRSAHFSPGYSGWARCS